MKGQTYVVLTILFIIIISVFAVLNVADVEVNYIFWKGESPLIFVILFSVLLGGVLTMVVSGRRYYTLHRENKQLKAKLHAFEQESFGKKEGKNKTVESKKEKLENRQE